MPHTKPRNDLLFEMGMEELPSKCLQDFSKAFLENIEKGFAAAELPYDEIKSYITPRRLAITMTGIIPVQPVRKIIKRGSC